MLDADGTIMGVRGIAIDVTAMDARVGQTAASLRRGEVLDHILAGIGREVLAPRMMQAALTGLSNAMGAEGAAVIVIPPGKTDAVLAHRAGDGGQDILSLVSRRLPLGTVSKTVTMEGRPALLAGCQTRFGAHGAIAVWRTQDARAWDEDDQQILGSAANLIRMVLEHEAIQQEMHRQARTDPLTGLLNRRAFLEEVERHIERLEKEELPGTLLFADLDHFKPVNDALGHEVGDQALVHLAALLRRVVRPTDLIARLGGDEFAVWMSGADHMTAAERADALRELVPRELGEIVGSDVPRLSVSIGIACRSARSRESLESLIRRADMAMYEVKRHGRGHWRVSLQEPRA
jgi:diguanylate cyclase (GGDEF)-like protein